MSIAFSKLEGLDEGRILDAVEPVLRAHDVEGVELVWKTDRSGWLLALTVEKPGSRVPGAGITVDLCSDISRDLSERLDALELSTAAYRLEVGSPGAERALYRLADYDRFRGHLAKLKFTDGEARSVLTGRLSGTDEAGRVLLTTDQGPSSVEFNRILSGHLVFEWKTGAEGPGLKRAKSQGPAKASAKKIKRREQGK